MKPKRNLSRQPKVGSSRLVRTALGRLRANIHRRSEYYRTSQSDPHGYNMALYVAMLEVENAINETISEISSPNNAGERRA